MRTLRTREPENLDQISRESRLSPVQTDVRSTLPLWPESDLHTGESQFSGRSGQVMDFTCQANSRRIRSRRSSVSWRFFYVASGTPSSEQFRVRFRPSRPTPRILDTVEEGRLAEMENLLEKTPCFLSKLLGSCLKKPFLRGKRGLGGCLLRLGRFKES